jgi:hypothetical protein
MSITKEGQVQYRQFLNLDPSTSQRYPHPDTGQDFDTIALDDSRVQVLERKDTILGVHAVGANPVEDILPQLHPDSGILPLSVVTPFVIDANGNGKYDPIDYIELGQ